MKRLLCLLLVLLLLFALASCKTQEEPTVMVQPVTFYYRTAQTDFSAEDGVIRAEIIDLGDERSYTDTEIFRDFYFLGPRSPELVAPFSPDTLLDKVVRSGGTLEIWLTRNAYSPAEFDHALTYACLAKTALALEGVHKVRIKVKSPGNTLLDDVMLTQSDILLYDNGAAQKDLEVTLYFADEEGSFLLTEKRVIPRIPQKDLPEYVIKECLLAGPGSTGLRSPLPPGTDVYLASVENGICSVNFNRDFFDNRSQDERFEQLAVLSVVNTLCELENVNQVQIYVEGLPLDRYVYLDLSAPWIMDSTPVGPIREELGEFAGVLCLPGQNDRLLHRFTIRARARGGASREEALLQALFNRSPQNGLGAPFAAVSELPTVSRDNDVCTVTLKQGSLSQEPEVRETALRSIAATLLCSLPELRSVCIRMEEDILMLQSQPPELSWFCTSER